MSEQSGTPKFHDSFKSRSVMRRMAHQAPNVLIAENAKLNAALTAAESRLAEVRLATIEECRVRCLKGLVSEESGQTRTPGTIKREAYNAAIHECAAALNDIKEKS